MECFFRHLLRNTKTKIKKANSIVKYNTKIKLKNKKQKPESISFFTEKYFHS